MSEQRLIVRVCECGLKWAGGNEKYCPAGHGYRFTAEPFVPASDLTAMREALEAASEALRVNATTWIALEGHLDEPYPDDPRWTPWTRFGKRAYRAAWDARTKAIEVLRSLPSHPNQESDPADG